MADPEEGYKKVGTLESQWGSEESKKEARAEDLSKIPETLNFHT